MELNRDIWVIGAGGIGTAFVKKCKSLGLNVVLISRADCNMASAESVAEFFNSVDYLPSVIINTVGILHDDTHTPEKSLSAFSADWFYESIQVNALPVMWIAQQLSKKLTHKDELIFITLSARVSSISDNRLGGWYSYRASKCVLNMLIKNISIEWSRQFPKVAICGYHPGTVDTKLSKPHQKHVSSDSLFSPQQAADYLFSQLERTDPTMSGSLFDWRGDCIEF